MSEFWMGVAAATYILVAAYFVTDGVKGWEWIAVVLWPVAVPVSFPVRWIRHRMKYEYRDDPRWGPGWYTRR